MRTEAVQMLVFSRPYALLRAALAVALERLARSRCNRYTCSRGRSRLVSPCPAVLCCVMLRAQANVRGALNAAHPAPHARTHLRTCRLRYAMENSGVTQCMAPEAPAPMDRAPYKPFLAQRVIESGVLNLPFIGFTALLVAVALRDLLKGDSRDRNQMRAVQKSKETKIKTQAQHDDFMLSMEKMLEEGASEGARLRALLSWRLIFSDAAIFSCFCILDSHSVPRFWVGCRNDVPTNHVLPP